MPKKKINAVIEAVHYTSGGQIEFVRAYERRGPVWSDVLLLNRPQLVDRLRNGQKFYSGSRKTYLGSQFDVAAVVLLENDRVISGKSPGSHDFLGGVPVF